MNYPAAGYGVSVRRCGPACESLCQGQPGIYILLRHGIAAPLPLMISEMIYWQIRDCSKNNLCITFNLFPS